MTQPVLINGDWREANSTGTFQATNPNTGALLDEVYPISSSEDCEAAIAAAAEAFVELRSKTCEDIAAFLEKYADLIEERKDDLVEMAHAETGLPKSPRLADGELPRTTNQLRQAAAAARSQSWCMPTIDTTTNIRSCYQAIGPVTVLGPNNFPFAFGSVSGGDFAAAIAVGNPVIGKANSSHPGTTRIFAEQAQKAAVATGMPKAMVQLIYRTSHDDGYKLVSDPRVGASGFTGSQHAGLKLKAAADSAGKPIYLELSSINPVVVLPGALAERGEEIAGEFAGSCLMGSGQFCTNPGLVILVKGETTDTFIAATKAKFEESPGGTLLSSSVKSSMQEGLTLLQSKGASQVACGPSSDDDRICNPNTILQVDGATFLADPESFQTEAFGNCSLFVVADSAEQIRDIVTKLEGNLTGCIYSDSTGKDDNDYHLIAPDLTLKVGRLLNDKMPTGVAVSAAMNHGGPYPATGHPGFTAVGIPGSLLRFSMLKSFDNIRPERLPQCLGDQNPGEVWRCIDGSWTQK